MHSLLIFLALLASLPAEDGRFNFAQESSVKSRILPKMNIKIVAIEQLQGNWKITLQSDKVIKGDNLLIKIDGFVSNSLSQSHMFPRFSSLTNENDDVMEKNMIHRIKEKVLIQSDNFKNCTEYFEYFFLDDYTLILTLKHIHHNNNFSPLLGNRHILLQTKNFQWNGDFHLNKEEYEAIGVERFVIRNELDEPWKKEFILTKKMLEKNFLHYGVPYGYVMYLTTFPERNTIDGGIFFNCDEPGGSYYRFNEVKVRPGSRISLKFSYKILKDTDGSFQYKLSEYEEDGSRFRVTHTDAMILKNNDQWNKFEKVIILDRETNNIALEFSFRNAEFGEAFVKDLIFEPIGGFRQTSP